MLILAGITINYLFSEGGLFETAKNSGNIWQGAQNSDINAIKDVNGMIANLVNGTGSGGTTTPTEPEDTIPPEDAIFGEFSKTDPEPNETITVTVTHNDGQSGVNITSCKWVYVKQNERTPIETNEADYTGGAFESNGQQLNLTATEEGTYYLHILTVDNAGNLKETISNTAINVKVKNILVSSITLDPNTKTVNKGDVISLNATISPENATNKNLQWTSKDESIATVDQNGNVTIKTLGNVQIEATASDDGKAVGSCSLSSVETCQACLCTTCFGRGGFHICEDGWVTCYACEGKYLEGTFGLNANGAADVRERMNRQTHNPKGAIEVCPECNGRGGSLELNSFGNYNAMFCSACYGFGFVPCETCNPSHSGSPDGDGVLSNYDYKAGMLKCSVCKGEGSFNVDCPDCVGGRAEICDKCGGDGKVE